MVGPRLEQQCGRADHHRLVRVRVRVRVEVCVRVEIRGLGLELELGFRVVIAGD